MDTATDDIRILIEIVRKDEEIAELKRTIEGAPARIRQIEKLVEGMDSQLKKSTETVKKLEVEKKRQNELIAGYRQKIEKHEGEKTLVKDNKQFWALLSEIEFLGKKIDEAETRILEIHESIDAENSILAETQRKINEEKDSLVEEKNGLERKVEASRGRLGVLEREKKEFSGRLSDRIARVYHRILQGKRDSAVADLAGDVCQGCFSRVPPQLAHEVRRNDRLILCETCGRILVYIDSGE